MLILSRKKSENIVIGDNIFITVLSSTENLVRLGIIAPPDITIHREEIYNKIKKQKKALKSSKNY